tara:strand:- start:16 stop:1251 length:1236 start_codon:yes stop_codon:yes gene_type:complete
MTEEERRRLYEQLGFVNIPITTPRYTAPYTAQVTTPSWGIGLSDGTPMITYGTPKDLLTQEATGGITWPEKPTTYDYEDIVQDIVNEQKFTTEVPSPAEVDVATQIDSFAQLSDPTYGLAATDPNLQGVTPFSMASTEPAMAPVQAGMAEVELPFFDRFPLAEQGMDQGTFDAIEHIDSIYGDATQESKKDTAGRMAWKEVVGALPTTGLLGDISNWAVSTVMHKGLPYSGFTGDDLATAKTAESMKDALNNMVIMDAKKSGVPKDDLIASVVTGVNPLIQTDANQLSAAAELVSKGGKLDRDDAVDMAYQVDSFRELVPQVIAKPRTNPAATNVVEEAEKARMRDLARQQELARQVYADLMAGRDRGEPSAREVQAAMERATQVDTFSGDRTGEVQAAMRDVGYGGANWT